MSNAANYEDDARQQRWLDRDPALSEAIESLKDAKTKYQAQVALNIIKVIVEHTIEFNTDRPVEDLVEDMQNKCSMSKNYYRRWYDVNETLSSALVLLQECPEDIQEKVIPSICRMIEEAFIPA